MATMASPPLKPGIVKSDRMTWGLKLPIRSTNASRESTTSAEKVKPPLTRARGEFGVDLAVFDDQYPQLRCCLSKSPRETPGKMALDTTELATTSASTTYQASKRAHRAALSWSFCTRRGRRVLRARVPWAGPQSVVTRPACRSPATQVQLVLVDTNCMVLDVRSGGRSSGEQSAARPGCGIPRPPAL